LIDAVKRRWRSLAALAAVSALFGLALWPVEPRGRRGDAAQAGLCRAKLTTLYRALTGGAGGSETLSESELNAHLAWILDRNPAAREARGLTAGIDDLRLDAGEGRASFFVAASLAGLPLVLEYRVAAPGPGDEPLGVRSVRLGRLPLVPPLDRIALGYLPRLLGGLRQERAILENLGTVEIGGDGVRIEVAAASG
jgi:hypothetical protein